MKQRIGDWLERIPVGFIYFVLILLAPMILSWLLGWPLIPSWDNCSYYPGIPC